MTARAWDEPTVCALDTVARAWGDMMRCVEARLGGGGVSAARVDEAAAALSALRAELGGRLADLSDELQAVLGGRGAAGVTEAVEAHLTEADDRAWARSVVCRVLEPLAFHADERVLERLPAALVHLWQRLQDDLLHSQRELDNGGEVFYVRVQQVLDASVVEGEPTFVSALVPAVYLFCLQGGFRGRHRGAEGDAAIRDVKHALAKRSLALAPELAAPAKQQPAKPAAVAWPRAAYLGVAAAVGVAAFAIVKWLVTA